MIVATLLVSLQSTTSFSARALRSLTNVWKSTVRHQSDSSCFGCFSYRTQCAMCNIQLYWIYSSCNIQLYCNIQQYPAIFSYAMCNVQCAMCNIQQYPANVQCAISTVLVFDKLKNTAYCQYAMSISSYAYKSSKLQTYASDAANPSAFRPCDLDTW